MGISERKEREKEHRRNTIVDAAEKVIFSKGLENATMDDIAEKAELSKGTLYLYFKSKEQLYMAIIVRAFSVQNRLFTEAFHSSETGLEKVKAIGGSYAKFYKDYPNYFNAMMYYELLQIDLKTMDEITQICIRDGEKNLGMLTEAIDIGKNDGSIRKDIDTFDLALLLWSTSNGVMQFSMVKGDIMNYLYSKTPQDLMEAYFEFMGQAMSVQ